MLQADDTGLGPLATVVASMPDKTISLDTSLSPVRIDGDTLTIQGTSSVTWPIQGMSQATLELSSATLTVTSADATSATVAATLPVAPGTAPEVTVSPATQRAPGPSVWRRLPPA